VDEAKIEREPLYSRGGWVSTKKWRLAHLFASFSPNQVIRRDNEKPYFSATRKNEAQLLIACLRIAGPTP